MLPKKKLYKKTGKKDTFRKNGSKKLSKIQTVVVREPGVVCADRYFVKMRWTDNQNYNGASPGTNVGLIRYRANSCYDPNSGTSATDKSVNGFYQLSQLYYRYRVHGAKVRVTSCNMGTTPVVVVVWPSNGDFSISPGVSYNNVQEQLNNPYAKWKLLSPTTGMDRCVIDNYISTQKLIGSKNVKYDDTYQATITSNPNNMWYWNVGCYPLNPLAVFGTNNVQFEARMTQYVEWFERQTIIQNYGSVEDGNPAPNVGEGAIDDIP